jgi:hypothetical protein
MSTRIVNPSQSLDENYIAVNANFQVGRQDFGVDVQTAGVVVTLPQNPTPGVTQHRILAEQAFTLTAGALGGLTPAFPSDPANIVAGDCFIVARTENNLWVKLSDAGGSGAGGNPLVRTKWIDGDTTTPGVNANGSAGLPYASVGAFITAVGNAASAADFNQNMVGLISPATTAAYTENPAFPVRNIELRAPSTSVLVTGTATWAVTGASGGETACTLALHNIEITGRLTVTDDASTTESIVISCDEGQTSTLDTGLTATGATALANINLINCQYGGNIVSTANGSGAQITTFGAAVAGAITARNITAVDSSFAGTAFTFAAGQTHSFTRCTFNGASPTVAGGAGSTVSMDLPSWYSFLEAGGTLSSGTLTIVGGSKTMQPWTAVAAGGTANAVHDGPNAFLCDATGAACTVNFPTAPLNGDIIGVGNATTVAAPTKIFPGAGHTAEDPGNPGNYVTHAAGATVTGQGQVTWWMFQTTGTRWKIMASA